MKEQLVGRQTESKLLREYAESDRAEFVAVYGRRRVGKTFLISEVFADHIIFETSGVIQGNSDDQFAAFDQSLRRIGYAGVFHKNWMDAFFALEQTLTPLIDETKRQVVFIDELPCLDVRRTRFVPALGHFWNSWASKHHNLMLVVCGSATSWMVDKIVNNHGGLHNRITHTMHLHPFNLAQCEQYFRSRNMIWDRLSILQAYMVFGGVPYYLSLINPSESVSNAIDRLLFSEQGDLRNEYDRLFASLFQTPEPYIAIVRELAAHRYGLTRDEISVKLGKSDGGALTKLLDTLVKCDFIIYHRVRLKKISKTGGYYTLKDSFVQFYHSYMESKTNDEHFWTHNIISPQTNTYYGLSFERVCMAHIYQIKRALGIDRIGVEYYSWRSKDSESGAQIDLVLERADRIINLCEIKYSKGPYIIDKDEDLKIRTGMMYFETETQTRCGIMPTFVSTYGLKPNIYSGGIMEQVTMDDLFME